MPAPFSLKCFVATALALLATQVAAAVGVFNPAAIYPTGGRAEAVAVGDVNDDGRNDVLISVGEDNNNQLFVFHQDLDGRLLPAIQYATANPATSLAVGDVNGDGLNEVLVGSVEGSIFVYAQGAGQLGISAILPYSNGFKIRIADLNGDGLNDVVGIDERGTTATVHLQNSDGTLSLSGSYYAPTGGYEGLEVGDINNDGRTDIVVMSGMDYAYDNIVALRQTADGAFAPATYHDLGGNQLTRGVGIGDINGDGLADVIVSSLGESSNPGIFIFAQNPSGGLDAPAHIDDGNPLIVSSTFYQPAALEIGDLDGDGRDDIAVLHGMFNNLGVYLQHPDGYMRPEELYYVPPTTYTNEHNLALGDINGDGMLDAVIADPDNGLVVLENRLVPELNSPPVPSLTGPFTGQRFVTYTYDASASSDPDGDPLTFEWKVDGVAAGTGPTLDVAFDTLGSHPVEVVIRDGVNAVGTVIYTRVDNVAPVADAGAPQAVKQMSDVTLSGSGTDVDGTVVTYAWRQLAGAAVTLVGADTPSASFKAPKAKDAREPLMFELQVTDNDGAQASATTEVTVSNR
jgi:hypothetical protein